MVKRALSKTSLVDQTSPHSKKPHLSLQAQAQQKLRETFRARLTHDEMNIAVNPQDGRTLRLRLERDIEDHNAGTRVITWGKGNTEMLIGIYRSDESVHAMLKCGDIAETVSPRFQHAMKQLKEKGSRASMLTAMEASTKVTTRDVVGVFRWFISLRLSCLKHQVPAAMSVLEFISRLRCSGK